MAVSISRPDPSSADDIAAASFTVSRRGYDQTEVKDLLRMVAAELARAQERERELERDLRGAQRTTPNAAVMLDEEVVTRMLGEEAARILSTAREAAAQIRARADENAAALLREASDEAHRMREEASVEASRRRTDATADAEAELEMAKQQGRDMVNEARDYRERVLSELSRRRELARQQVDQLLHGRDRLLQAFERARLAAVDVMAEMAPLGEPAEYVNLDPVTAPVPAMIPATRRVPEPAPTPSEPAAAPAEAEVIETEVVEAEVVEAEVVETEVVETEEEPPSNVVALFGSATPDDVVAAPEPDDVFARLRAARAESVAERANDDTASVTSVFARTPAAPVEPDVDIDDSPFSRRDAAVTPLIVAAAKRLKRVLADEQNDLLATLRRNEPVHTLDALVVAFDEHADRYATAVRGDLVEAAHAGASTIVGDDRSAHPKAIDAPATVQPAVAALGEGFVAPLRDRLERAIADAAGDNVSLGDSVRALYREWKNQRLDDRLEYAVHLAFGHGALVAIDPGTPVCWRVDPHGPACPDAEDNALAGAVPAGDAFPTGNAAAPAHEGCRCMLALAPR
jgi:DivIVA domain-containing protein